MPAMPLDALAGSSTAASRQRSLARGRVAEQHTLTIGADDCLIRAVLIESIEYLLADSETTEDGPVSDDPMQEPLLDQIDEQAVQFHGQMTAPPRARRRQKLVSSRAVFHRVVRR